MSLVELTKALAAWSTDPDELGQVALDLHQRVKAVFDPAGILNPGKALS